MPSRALGTKPIAVGDGMIGADERAADGASHSGGRSVKRSGESRPPSVDCAFAARPGRSPPPLPPPFFRVVGPVALARALLLAAAPPRGFAFPACFLCVLAGGFLNAAGGGAAARALPAAFPGGGISR